MAVGALIALRARLADAFFDGVGVAALGAFWVIGHGIGRLD